MRSNSTEVDVFIRKIKDVNRLSDSQILNKIKLIRKFSTVGIVVCYDLDQNKQIIYTDEKAKRYLGYYILIKELKRRKNVRLQQTK